MFFVKNGNIRDAAFHFSVEELFTRYIKKTKPVLMLWQADKTVMLGNNQIVEAELDKEFAESSAIQIVRRSSGGGAIYTDTGTVLYTLIEPITEEAKTHREKLAANIIFALKEMGVTARREGRNDILVEGRKISGLAQYTVGNHVCTHGSLLYDTDLEVLTRVLKPNEEKLHPKGITSIRSRVTTIKPYIPENFKVPEFIDALKKALLSDKDFELYELNVDELIKVNRIKNDKYANHNWNLNL